MLQQAQPFFVLECKIDRTEKSQNCACVLKMCRMMHASIHSCKRLKACTKITVMTLLFAVTSINAKFHSFLQEVAFLYEDHNDVLTFPSSTEQCLYQLLLQEQATMHEFHRDAFQIWLRSELCMHSFFAGGRCLMLCMVLMSWARKVSNAFCLQPICIRRPEIDKRIDFHSLR